MGILLCVDDDGPRVEEDIRKEVEAVLLVTAHRMLLVAAAYHRDSIRLEVEDSILVVGSSRQEGEGSQ